ncbi:MAG: ABC transporter C-terminal domain-containing protein [Christensenellales bacterium]
MGAGLFSGKKRRKARCCFKASSSANLPHCRLRAQLRKCEDEISALEQGIEEKEALLSQPEIATDYQKMMEITQAIDQTKQQLEQAMERWEDLSLQVGD